MAYARDIICADCAVAVQTTAPRQRYCAACSERRDLQRKRLWAKKHPPGSEQRQRDIAASGAKLELARLAGQESNAQSAESITWAGEAPDLLWMARISVPFSYAMSKNAIYRLVPRGHVCLRREAKDKRDAISILIRQALSGRKVAHNKVWLDILVQKPNHKGDAVNVIDTVCDAVKCAIPVDDRWFCIHRLDWQIVKDDPRLIIGIGQDSSEDCQVCSFCGQIKTVDAFGRRSGNRLGVGRVCHECRRAGRILGKAAAPPIAGGTP